IEKRYEDQGFRNHIRAVREVLHPDRRAGLRSARSQPAGQHESAENQEPVEAEHELRDLPRQAGLEQRQLDQDESEDSPYQMSIGASDERAAAINARKGGVVAGEIGHVRNL